MADDQNSIARLIAAARASFNCGNLNEAGQLIEKVLAKDLANPDALKLLEGLGICYLQANEFEKSEHSFKKLLLLSPDNINAYANLASSLQFQGKYSEAIINYQKYDKFFPGNPQIYNNIGLALDALGKYSDAGNYFLQATLLDQNNPNFFYNLAINLQSRAEFSDSLKYFAKAIYLKQDDPDFYNNRAYSFQSLQLLEEAEENYNKAIEIFSGNPEFFSNLGSVVQQQGKFSEAIENYEQALKINPAGEKYYYNLAVCQEKTGEYKQAINNYLQAIRLKPGYADAHWNLSLILLLLGEFNIGWKEYEWRFLSEGAEKIIAAKPLWDGRHLPGKTIFIKQEQGFGDAIQFCRYLPLVKEKGGKVIFEAPPALIKLFDSLSGPDVIVPAGLPDSSLPHYDYYLPLMSLPLIFKTGQQSIPSAIPYLHASVGVSKACLAEINQISGLRVGIVWEGNPENKNNSRRSCPMHYFYQLAETLNIKFFSLQKGSAQVQLHSLPQENKRIIDLAGYINDFSDTAAIINSIDLVISVDTSVCHLAGALGHPVFTLLHFTPDWRWLLNRNDSPWYPSMKLFRQQETGDWKNVFDQLKVELNNVIKNFFP